MTIIEPKRRDTGAHHIKKNSAPLRLWHWLNTLVITGSLLTVLLNSTVLKSRSNAAPIQQQLAQAGVTVTNDQARAAAHVISDKIWTVHTYFGYTLAALLLFRLILEFFQQADQKLMRKIKIAYNHYYKLKRQREIALHEFLVKTIYGIFYLMLFMMVLTGFCLAFEDDAPLLRSMHWIREAHSFTMYLILAFIAVHLAGVFLAERTDSPGIISDMVNGGRHEE